MWVKIQLFKVKYFWGQNTFSGDRNTIYGIQVPYVGVKIQLLKFLIPLPSALLCSSQKMKNTDGDILETKRAIRDQSSAGVKTDFLCRFIFFLGKTNSPNDLSKLKYGRNPVRPDDLSSELLVSRHP